MAKSIYTVTAPVTITIVLEASDDKDAAEKFRAMAKAGTLGCISVVGDPKVAAVVAAGKAKAKDKEEEDEDEEEEEEDEDEEEEEKPKKSDKKDDKKPEKSGGKVKIKLKKK